MKVSIITPTFNHGKFIAECIESVLAQTETSWEQIVIDDCSTDGTPDIVTRYRDPRIRLLRTTTRNGVENLSRTYNQALASTSADLVAVLEGDDYWPPHKLASQCAAFDTKQVVLTWGQTARDVGGRIENSVACRASLTRLRHPKSTQWLLMANAIGAVTVMVRKAALEEIGGFYQVPGTVVVDYSTWLRLCRVGEFRYVPKILGFWRIHGTQTTRVRRREVFAGTVRIVEDALRTWEKPCGNSTHLRRFATAQICLCRGVISHLDRAFLRAMAFYLRALCKFHCAERASATKLAMKAACLRPL